MSLSITSRSDTSLSSSLMRMRLTETAGLTVKNRTSSSPTSVFTRGNGNRAGPLECETEHTRSISMSVAQ